MIFLWAILAITFFSANSSDASSFTPDWEKISLKALPDVIFTDAREKTVHLSDYKGKILLLHPMFTQCPSTCTFISSRLATAIKGLSKVEQDDLRILSFSFDAKETSGKLAKFEKTFQVDGLHWKVVKTKPEMLQQILTALDYRTLQLGTSNYEHPNLLFVVGKDGVLRDYIYGGDLSSDRLKGMLRSAEAGYSSFPAVKSYVYAFAVIGLLISTFVVASHFAKVHRQ